MKGNEVSLLPEHRLWEDGKKIKRAIKLRLI